MFFRFSRVTEYLVSDDPFGRFIQIFVDRSRDLQILRPQGLIHKRFGRSNDHGRMPLARITIGSQPITAAAPTSASTSHSTTHPALRCTAHLLPASATSPSINPSPLRPAATGSTSRRLNFPSLSSSIRVSGGPTDTASLTSISSRSPFAPTTASQTSRGFTSASASSAMSLAS